MYSFQLHFRLFTVFRANVRYWASLSNNRVPPLYNHPPPLEMQRVKLEVSPKHKETQTICMYLGIYKIALFWVWTVSADIFGWMYLYLYLYLNRCICICICIWIKVEQNICICIWKIQIFVFVFVFDKTYLTPALVAIHEPGQRVPRDYVVSI